MRKQGRPRGEERVLGPYKAPGGKWSIVFYDGDGARFSRKFGTEEEAKEFCQAIQEEIGRRKRLTLQQAIDQYEAHLKEKGLKPSTRETALYRLYAFFPNPRLPLSAVTKKLCAGYYRALAERQSVDTHRNTLSLVKNFFGYLKKKGLLEENPAEEIEGEGKRNKGKKQLYLDESRAWTSKALELAEEGKDGAVAALLAFLLGLRASEIVNAQVRDVDDEGRLFWIPDGKTKNSRRKLQVPEMLQPHLLRLARGRKREEFLFLKWGTRKHHRDFVRYWVMKICRAARVPEITAHGMRGTHASLGTESGVSPLALAQALGHSSPAITQAHYSTRESQEQAKAARLLRVLEGGKR